MRYSASLNFGAEFSPVNLRRTTTRPVSYYALFELVVLAVTHPFPLNSYFGTLVVDLGCFPFDYETYLTQSDSLQSNICHSEFIKLR